MRRLVLLVCSVALAACDGGGAGDATVRFEKVTDSGGEAFFRFGDSGLLLVVRDEASTRPAPNVIVRAVDRGDGVGLFLFDQAGHYLPRLAWAPPGTRDVWMIGATDSEEVRVRAVDHVPAGVALELVGDSMRRTSVASLEGLGEAVRDALATNSPFADSGAVRLVEFGPQGWVITTFECGSAESFPAWADHYRAGCHPESARFEIWTPHNPFVADVVVVPDTASSGMAGPTISLGGIVRDSATGAPLAGATVDLQPGSLRATTDASGGFSFETIPVGCLGAKSVVLIASRRGYRRAAVTGVQLGLVAGNFGFAGFALRPGS